jgi:hypothetical protein
MAIAEVIAVNNRAGIFPKGLIRSRHDTTNIRSALDER